MILFWTVSDIFKHTEAKKHFDLLSKIVFKTVLNVYVVKYKPQL